MQLGSCHTNKTISRPSFFPTSTVLHHLFLFASFSSLFGAWGKETCNSIKINKPLFLSRSTHPGPPMTV